ncbi:MAG: DUF447 family protein [Hyphomicrobiaceae bacterium]|nr:DUF447 family protein [Hyphomicrobiaceae bacterium]
MPFIVETIITTRNEEGQVHVAPLGLIKDGDANDDTAWILAPFRPSRTLDNLISNGFAVANHVDDVRVFANCIMGRRNWPVQRALKGDGGVMTNAAVHWEMQVERLEEDEVRPRFHCRVVHAQTHRPWSGFNRAQAAVIEAAVLATRLHMLPSEKIETELAYLNIAIEKTAGPREAEAWATLMEKFDAWRAGDRAAVRKA